MDLENRYHVSMAELAALAVIRILSDGCAFIVAEGNYGMISLDELMAQADSIIDPKPRLEKSD